MYALVRSVDSTRRVPRRRPIVCSRSNCACSSIDVILASAAHAVKQVAHPGGGLCRFLDVPRFVQQFCPSLFVEIDQQVFNRRFVELQQQAVESRRNSAAAQFAAAVENDALRQAISICSGEISSAAAITASGSSSTISSNSRSQADSGESTRHVVVIGLNIAGCRSRFGPAAQIAQPQPQFFFGNAKLPRRVATRT